MHVRRDSPVPTKVKNTFFSKVSPAGVSGVVSWQYCYSPFKEEVEIVSAAGAANYVDKLGIQENEVVQELGWDDDCDASISESIEDAIGEALLDHDTDELCDVVLLWHRADDEDLVDSLVDATRNLSDSGRIWLLTPGANQPGEVHPGDISESAQLAGLVQTKADRLGEWQGSCLRSAGVKK